jgi:perosamine synthetase
MYSGLIKFIRQTYKTDDFLPLHEPVFFGNEKKYLNEYSDSTFGFSVETCVERLEATMAEYTGAKYAIAVADGVAPLYSTFKGC